MDITDTADLGASHVSTASVTYPAKIAYNSTIQPLLKKLDKNNMHAHLETFTSFHTRYYKSSYGAQSSKWLLAQVSDTLEAAGALKHGATVKPFAHPWGQNSIIA